MSAWGTIGRRCGWPAHASKHPGIAGVPETKMNRIEVQVWNLIKYRGYTFSFDIDIEIEVFYLNSGSCVFNEDRFSQRRDSLHSTGYFSVFSCFYWTSFWVFHCSVLAQPLQNRSNFWKISPRKHMQLVSTCQACKYIIVKVLCQDLVLDSVIFVA